MMEISEEEFKNGLDGHETLNEAMAASEDDGDMKMLGGFTLEELKADDNVEATIMSIMS